MKKKMSDVALTEKEKPKTFWQIFLNKLYFSQLFDAKLEFEMKLANFLFKCNVRR